MASIDAYTALLAQLQKLPDEPDMSRLVAKGLALVAEYHPNHLPTFQSVLQMKDTTGALLCARVRGYLEGLIEADKRSA